jgi:hypothetical protein
VRLDHLLSKEHTPRTGAARPGLLDGVVCLALVVFTSGIVDEGPVLGSSVSQYYLSRLVRGGCGTWGGRRGIGW